MSWETVGEASAKDRWEDECAKWRDGTYLRALQGGLPR
jgi:hypothetical protein